MAGGGASLVHADCCAGFAAILASVSRLQRLRTLRLSFFGAGHVRDGDLASLALAGGLRSLALKLSGCGIGDRGAEAIADALPEGLHELELGLVGGSDGAVRVA